MRTRAAASCSARASCAGITIPSPPGRGSTPCRCCSRASRRTAAQRPITPRQRPPLNKDNDMGLAPKLLLTAVTALAGSAAAAAAAQGTHTAMAADNPFAQPSTLPFGLPPFDRIHDRDYLPAFEARMRTQLSELAVVAHDSQAPL